MSAEMATAVHWITLTAVASDTRLNLGPIEIPGMMVVRMPNEWRWTEVTIRVTF